MGRKMKTILVASDLSDRADIALQRAVTIARRTKAALHVVYVVDGALPLSLGEVQRDAAEDLITRQLRDMAGDDLRQTTVLSIFGDPAEDIAATAQDIAADLIVVGRHRDRDGASDWAEMFSGTTVDRLARITAVPLLVATGSGKTPYRNAVVGIDASDSAANAVCLAAVLAGPDNLTLVHAYHPPFRARLAVRGPLSQADRDHVESAISQDISDWLRRCGATGEGAGVTLAEGHPRDILRQIAAEVGADLICVGVHSRSRLSAALLGGTARALLATADCDILIAPPGPAEPAPERSRPTPV